MLKSFFLIIRLVYPHVPAGVCSSPVIKNRDQRPESYTATHSKNCIVYCAEQVAHDLDLISLYFYFVRWNPRWKKYKIWLSVGKQCKQTSSLLLIATVGVKFSSSNFSFTFSSIPTFYDWRATDLQVTTTVAQFCRAFASHAGDRGSIPGCVRPNSLKHVTAPLPSARQ